MTEEMIVAEGISLDFPMSKTGSGRLKEAVTGRFRLLKGGKPMFRALEDINFSLKKGEVLGVIGSNGSGKSTLLRVIAGIYAPDAGVVKTRGVVSLLAGLGTGFQQDLSGIDNIRLASSLLGMGQSRCESLLPEIIEFSGIKDFIEQPLRTYSAGMRSRLSFSVVAHLDPDVILLDEVFSVGDKEFKAKSRDRIIEMVKGDATVVIVSHDHNLVKDLCDRVIVMAEGKVLFDGEPEIAIKDYR